MIALKTPAEVQALKELAHASPTAEITLTALGKRMRARRSNNIAIIRRKLVQSGAVIEDAHYYKLFKGLEKLGLGKVITGRNGKPCRFNTNYNLREISTIATSGPDASHTVIHTMGNAIELGSVPHRAKTKMTLVPKPKPQVNEIATQEALEAQSKIKAHITLRDDLTVSFDLPLDFNTSDVAKINRILQSLALSKTA